MKKCRRCNKTYEGKYLNCDRCRLYRREQAKKYDKRNPEKRKRHLARRERRDKIGNMIKSEALQEPASRNKMLWKGFGTWAKEYDACVECGLRLYKHKAKGICEKCYRRLHYENHREKEIKAAGNYRKKEGYNEKRNARRVERRNAAKDFIEKARNQQIEMTPKIINLLAHLEDKL